MHANNRKSESDLGKNILQSRGVLYVLVIRKKVSMEYSNCIETHLDVFVEVIYFHSSVTFQLCIDEELV